MIKNAVILTCGILEEHVAAAQEKMGTNFPVEIFGTENHNDPGKARDVVNEFLAGMEETYDVILVAMGFCGGTWENVTSKKKIILPRVDDCVTLMMTHTEDCNINLKQPGIMYLNCSIESDMSILGIRQKLIDKYGEKRATKVMDLFFKDYHTVGVVETGVFDSRGQAYTAYAQENAKAIDAELTYIPGSNLLLEKLVSGRWDDQFLILEPGQSTNTVDFLKGARPLSYAL